MTNPDQLANLADILRALTIAAVARNAYRGGNRVTLRA